MAEKIVRASTKALMTVYEDYKHKTNVKPNPDKASIMSPRKDRYGLAIFESLLEDLQRSGVKPGTRLKITVETVR